ncbi:MAG: trypsin-like peptidase domain-containing protein [Patescibacteria group bacterium]|nr:trypsin-like peptidase domain-containing protein [Patescibacteria group bacterium]
MKEQDSVIKAVKKVLPTVVSITVSKNLEFFESPAGFFGQAPYNKLYRGQEFFGPPFFGQPKRKKVKIGGGSGFIVDSSGIILTNRHVVEDEEAEYLVVLQNEEKLKAEVLARDPINDVAILKIDPSSLRSSGQEKTGLPTVELGDSSKLELGQTVIAIGNALGLFQNTVSTGVVSGLSREIKAQSEISQERTKLRGLIQTDAAINPGNSGGPLVNLEGAAIGINAAMVFGAENIGFALPINNAKRDLLELKNYGRIRQPFLGVRYVLIDEELKEKFNLTVNFGALVISEPDILEGIKTAVVPGSPADKAGIREADIILEMGNKKINENQTLSDILQECQVNQKLPLKILRGGKEKNLKIILAEKK